FFFQAEDGIRDRNVTGVQTCALPISPGQRVNVFTRQLAGELGTSSTFINLQAQASAAFWLDSASAHLGQGKTSLLGTNHGPLARSEERRVGKEGRTRGWRERGRKTGE